MNDIVHEPLKYYNTVLREAHARHTAAFFEDMVRRSGVDERENAQTVSELRKLNDLVSKAQSAANGWTVALWAVAIAFLCLEAYLYFIAHLYGRYTWVLMGGALVAFAPVIYKLKSMRDHAGTRLTEHKRQRDAARSEAYRQMEPLNRLYDWDIAARLITKTLPLIFMDPYFSNARLQDLRQNFGWNDTFNDGRSIVFSHTGVLNGNPFVLARTLDHWMGTKTYHGSLTITWVEYETDSNGDSHAVRHSQVLHASVTEPFPEYGYSTFIIYGNEAAPDLSFSRKPSPLSKGSDGVIGKLRKANTIRTLEAKSRKLGKGKNFMVMANREFDALFGASDRDHEVQFRLLFTPLAQQEMLHILKDKEIGYGDDFKFSKTRMINIVQPEHMNVTEIDAAPETFHSYDLAYARKHFNQYHNNLFRSFYFGMAPLLAIPLYQQHRSHADIYKDAFSTSSSFWEHEAIANYFGESKFQHPNCVTRSILKTSAQMGDDAVQTVHVTAFGYASQERVTYVSVYGGDGAYHDVPVHWIEYTPVQKTSTMIVRERISAAGGDGESSATNSDAAIREAFQKRGVDLKNAVLRRAIFAAITSSG